MLPTHFDKEVKLAIIGGTGLYKIDSIKPVAELTVDTPWGKPSGPITIAETEAGNHVAFLSRHGANHQHSPSTVPAQANIAALKSIGVEAIVAFSAVGSLQPEIRPRDFVVPSQIIDRTKGVRPSSFYGAGFVGHTGFGEPFDVELRSRLQELLDAPEGKLDGEYEGQPSTWHFPTKDDLTVICMEGPAFSTRAESRMYRSFGGSVINMSVIPEAKLAKEAEIAYQMICMSTDYDAWREGEDAVTVETVIANLSNNGANALRVCQRVIDPLVKDLDNKRFQSLKGSMKFSVSTAPAGRSPEMLAKLEFLHPGYYS